MSTPSIMLYHAVPTRSCRVAWLLEELNVPYQTTAVDFPADLSTPAFLAKNPLGTVPYMEDGDVTMGDSLTMILYILERYGKGKMEPSMATDPAARTEFLKVLLFAEVTLAAPLTLFAMHGSFLPEEKRDAAVAAHFKAKSIKALQALELVMSDGRKYISGNDFNAADCVGGHTLLIAELLGLLDAAVYPKVAAYNAMVKEMPAYKKVFGVSK